MSFSEERYSSAWCRRVTHFSASLLRHWVRKCWCSLIMMRYIFYLQFPLSVIRPHCILRFYSSRKVINCSLTWLRVVAQYYRMRYENGTIIIIIIAYFVIHSFRVLVSIALFHSRRAFLLKWIPLLDKDEENKKPRDKTMRRAGLLLKTVRR